MRINGFFWRTVALGPLWACILLCPFSAAQPLSPVDAARRMTLPAGFFAEAVVAEPLIRQPVAIDFDHKGRLWVLQYLQYPNPEGLKRARVDRFSRTQYDRVPEPPPRGPKGADKLTILEPDPQAPQKLRPKDFITGLNLASGFAFGHGGVYILQVPYLLFYPDRDGNDIPDGDPEALLTGFGMEDAHSVANSLAWGPDGWLYGCQGSTVTANIRGIEFQQGVWRFHPITRKFELFCEGGGNSWGLDFDRHGNLLYSTNHGGFVMLHGVQGGYYWKSFGKHGALHHPRAYGYFDHVPHKNFFGGHVSVGGVVYNGDAYPDSFRGQYIAADLLGHGVYSNSLQANGASFRSAHAEKLLLANDSWFAPTDLCLGPDGCVYTADWHDKRTAHPDPDADWDRSNGRVFRIDHHGRKPRDIPDLSRLPSKELVSLLSHSNGWHSRTAARLLAQRRDPEVIFPLRHLALNGPNPDLQVKAFWAAYVSGGFTPDFAPLALRHENEDIRAWAVRFLGDEDFLPESLGKQLLFMAKKESSARVRSQLASTARRLRPEVALPLLDTLLSFPDQADPHIPLLLWWAVEKFSQTHSEEVIALTARHCQTNLMVYKEILPRLVRRYAAAGSADGQVAKLLELMPSNWTDHLLLAVALGWEERPTNAKASAPVLVKSVREIIQENPQSIPSLILLVRWGEANALTKGEGIILDQKMPLADRVKLIQALAEAPSHVNYLNLFSRLLNRAESEAVQLQAIQALIKLGTAEAGTALLTVYQRVSAEARSSIRDGMLGRKEWAIRILQEVEGKKIAATDFSLEELRLASFHNHPRINQLLRNYWGNIRPRTPEERLADVRRLNNDLRAGPGNPINGKVLFTKACASCHKFLAEGGTLGPDLTTSNRFDRDALLVSLVDPGSIIRKEYMNYVVELKDGRVLTGLVVENTAAGIVLANAKNERTAVAREKISSLHESEVSFMPDNLWKELKPQELRDLFSYLQQNLDKGSKP